MNLQSLKTTNPYKIATFILAGIIALCAIGFATAYAATLNDDGPRMDKPALEQGEMGTMTGEMGGKFKGEAPDINGDEQGTIPEAGDRTKPSEMPEGDLSEMPQRDKQGDQASKNDSSTNDVVEKGKGKTADQSQAA